MSYVNQTIRVDKLLSEHVRYLPPGMKNYLKVQMEKFTNVAYRLGEIELQLVVDANMLIAAGIAKCKGRVSFLYQLASSPHLKLCAPPTLIQELEKIIQKKADRNNVDASAVKASIEPLLNKVSILNADDPAIQRADKLIGARDGGDIPYVALYIHTNSHGILTKDNDIRDLPQIANWNLTGVAKVLTIFENGAFSFHALAFDVPVLLRILYEACLSILGYIWTTITSLISGFAQMVSGGLVAMSKSSALTAFVSLCAVAAYIYAKEVCVQMLTSIVSTVSNFLSSVYNAIKNIIEFIGEFIQLGISVLTLLYKNIEDTIATCNNLSKDPVTVASSFC